MTINDKLATIQTKFKSKKSRFNSFGKYYFRSAEDILEATKPYLLELGVSVTINEELIASDPMPILQTSATVSDGKDNIVLFYTNRYKDQPLIIKGAGAGAEVTASGIFGDIIRTGNK